MLLDLLETDDDSPVTISKTRYMAARQCDKRLYLEVHGGARPDADSEDTLSAFAIGNDIGAMAREKFPTGVLVELEPGNPTKAVQATRLAIKSEASIIFEATLMHDGTQASADVLEKRPDGRWNMIEVKASGRVKDEYIEDLAMQVWVFRNAGIDVASAMVMHPDKEYVMGKVFDVDKYFLSEDVTERVDISVAQIEAELERQRGMLSQKTAPAIKVGGHCSKPYKCPFFGHCHRQAELDGVEHPVSDLPRLSHDQLVEFLDAGHKSIKDIPDSWSLTPKHEMIRQVVKNDLPYVDQEAINAALQHIEPPFHFLDFETIQPHKPLWEGTRAYQIMPVQFSNHTVTEEGDLWHSEYLHGTNKAPTKYFLRQLKMAVGDKGTIFVYSPYEVGRLKEAAKQLPEFADDINAIITRVVDLLPIVRAHTYHPQYRGSYSIKDVMPVWAPQVSYKGLEIQNGQQAAQWFLKKVDPDTSPAERIEISSALLTYCQLDTKALMNVFLRIAKSVVEEKMTYRVGAKRKIVHKARSKKPSIASLAQKVQAAEVEAESANAESANNVASPAVQSGTVATPGPKAKTRTR